MTPLVTIPHATGSYPVFVGRGLLRQAGELVEPRGDVFVITSASLRERFGETVLGSFSGARLIEVTEGESAKTLATVERMITRLLEGGARRDSMVVALGGGVLGDTAGFAASVLLRGVDLVHVPTTFVSQVDSSLGGKVGVNHALGKNLIGSFHQPRAVIIDPAVLDSLPARDFVSGVFESLKGGVIADPLLFETIEKRADDVLGRSPSVIDEVIRRKIAVKASIVSADEREGGLRRLLNYGHTIGHGIETAARYEGVTHGEAVALGMIGANAIASRRGILGKDESSRIDRTIRALRPETRAELSARDVMDAAERDKKNRSGARVMVLPRRIGECVIVDDVTESELEYGIAAALAAP